VNTLLEEIGVLSRTIWLILVFGKVSVNAIGPRCLIGTVGSLFTVTYSSTNFCTVTENRIYLTPYPSPAGTFVYKRITFLAGEGSKDERGLRPLSKISSPFQTNK
jgi:hypothetical protein